MAPNLIPLGYLRGYRHPTTGEIVVDTDSLRRRGFSGEEDFGYDDDDDFDGDDFEGDDDDDDDDDFEGYDFGDDEDDDFGAGWWQRRKEKRRGRKRRRLNRRKGRINRRLGKLEDKEGKKPAKPKVTWGMTAIGGTETLTDAGSATVQVRLQHHFRAQDLTFTGSADGAKVTSIFFGDRVVWSNSDGIDVGVFASNGFLRGLLKGQSLRAGLDITVNGTLSGAGDFAVALVGLKPTNKNC